MEENFDGFIFSCDWDKYQDNILIDKESKTVGAWSLDREKIKQVKYAYAYLTNSDKTVVKKFHIDKWEDAQKDKGYAEDWKLCFVFSHSEDVFFEWNKDPVQAPRYVSSSELDNLPRLNEDEIKVHLRKSEVTPKVAYYSDEGEEECATYHQLLDRTFEGKYKHLWIHRPAVPFSCDELNSMRRKAMDMMNQGTADFSTYEKSFFAREYLHAIMGWERHSENKYMCSETIALILKAGGRIKGSASIMPVHILRQIDGTLMQIF